MRHSSTSASHQHSAAGCLAQRHGQRATAIGGPPPPLGPPGGRTGGGELHLVRLPVPRDAPRRSETSRHDQRRGAHPARRFTRVIDTRLAARRPSHTPRPERDTRSRHSARSHGIAFTRVRRDRVSSDAGRRLLPSHRQRRISPGGVQMIARSLRHVRLRDRGCRQGAPDRPRSHRRRPRRPRRGSRLQRGRRKRAVAARLDMAGRGGSHDQRSADA